MLAESPPQAPKSAASRESFVVFKKKEKIFVYLSCHMHMVQVPLCAVMVH